MDITRHPHWNLLEHLECGITLADRIIGGSNATLGQYPWLARIGYVEDYRYQYVVYKCAGALINKFYVVTAAHCVYKLPKKAYIAVVRLGEHNTATTIDCEAGVCAAPVQDFRPIQVLVHRNYNKPAFKNDIALIRLSRPAVFNGWVQPICFPYGEQLMKTYKGSNAEVAGWGVYNVSYPVSSEVLRFVRLPVIDNELCQSYFESYADIGQTQLCAGGITGKDSCGGDSGSPLVKVEVNSHDTPRYYILGFVSFGVKKCGATHMPGVYTRIASYAIWILNNIAP